MKKKLKSILVVILCIFIIGSVVIDNMYCTPVVIGLYELAPLIAKILVTAGCSYIAVNGFYDSVSNCTNGMTYDLQTQLSNDVYNMTGNAIKISESVWNYVKNWAESNVSTGENFIISDATSTYSPTTQYGKNSRVTLTSREYGITDTYHWEATGAELPENRMMMLVCEDHLQTGTAEISYLNWLEVSYFTVEILDATHELYYNFYTDTGSWYMSTIGHYQLTFDGIGAIDNYESKGYMGESGILDNPDYIHGNSVTGENAFLLDATYTNIIRENSSTLSNQNIDDLYNSYVGLTYTDVKAEDLSVAGDIPVDSTDVVGAVNAVNVSVQSLSNTVARFFDLTQTIEWQPLQVAGDMFTNRFPFSLPWDLYNSFASLATEGVQPNFNITVPDTNLLKGFSFTVDLSMFSELLIFAKAIELLCFDIGLILITRKLLGGGV